MMPKIVVKFRRRNGIPYAIEQFTGKQFRCRHCNQVFWKESELEKHIEFISKSKKTKNLPVEPHVPELNQMLEVKVGYVYDINDCMNRRYLKLKKNEIYDGITLK